MEKLGVTRSKHDIMTTYDETGTYKNIGSWLRSIPSATKYTSATKAMFIYYDGSYYSCDVNKNHGISPCFSIQ
jgi:hypothetical protein